MAKRPDWEVALTRCGLIETLAAFDPRVVGTLPLGVATPASDIDILAHAPDAHAVSAVLLERHGHESRFFIRQWTTADRPVIAGFVAHGWAFEVYASAAPVDMQPGWLHFTVERRLLELGGDAIRDAVMLRRRQGLKTEPAFAEVLGLVRDPYAAMLSLAREGDGRLKAMLVAAGFKTRDH